MIIFQNKKNSSTLEYKSVPNHLNELLGILFFQKIKKECSPGTYGQGCSNNCSGHCLNDAACNITTGSCDQGCQAGYAGRLCDKGLKLLFMSCTCKYMKTVSLVRNDTLH